MTKTKLLIALLLVAFQIGFSQTEKRISGTVLCENLPVQGIEVINAVSKKTTVTDSHGHFSILVKAKDLLVFVSKTHDFKKLTLDQEDIDRSNFTISLNKKAEELEEVMITKMPSLNWKKDTKWEEGMREQAVLEKARDFPKNRLIKDGTIENGADLMRIGGMIIDLFRKEKEPTKKSIPEIEFKALATTTCSKDFFSKDLKLKPEEIPLFLQFCDADPQSKIISENANVLSLMDFMFAKNVEFKKLSTAVK